MFSAVINITSHVSVVRSSSIVQRPTSTLPPTTATTTSTGWHATAVRITSIRHSANTESPYFSTFLTWYDASPRNAKPGLSSAWITNARTGFAAITRSRNYPTGIPTRITTSPGISTARHAGSGFSTWSRNGIDTRHATACCSSRFSFFSLLTISFFDKNILCRFISFRIHIAFSAV